MINQKNHFTILPIKKFIYQECHPMGGILIKNSKFNTTFSQLTRS